MHKHKGNFGYFSNFIRHGAIFSNVLHFALYTTNMKVACLLVARYALDTEKSKQHLYNFHPGWLHTGHWECMWVHGLNNSGFLHHTHAEISKKLLLLEC